MPRRAIFNALACNVKLLFKWGGAIPPFLFGVLKMEVAIAVPGEHMIWNLYKTEDAARAALPAIREETGHPYEIITDLDGFFDAARSKFLTGPVKCSLDNWNYALECLPPMGWGNRDGVERFSISEFTYDRVTEQYGRIRLSSGDYICAHKPVIYGEPASYITADEIWSVQND
jgi:hypothetical protein